MQFILLGPVGIEVSGEAIPIGRPRSRAVLSYLLLNANKVVSTYELIEALWGGAEPATARTQVQGDISTLRRAGRELGCTLPVLSKVRGYSVHVEAGELDLDVFRAHMARAREKIDRGEFEAAISLIRSGLALWRGTALSDIAVSFAESARAQLTEMRLDAYLLLADLESAMGNHAASVQELMPLVAVHALHEELCRKFMLALHRSGRRTQALECARKLRTQLAEEQGLLPGQAFTELEQAILRADPVLDLPASAPVQRLSWTPNQRVVPAQLPAAPMDFVGRGELIRQLDSAVSSGSAGRKEQAPPLIAVVGPAGSGKTALTTFWARGMVDRFPDGQLFIDLRGYDTGLPVTPIDALTRFLRALGFASDVIPTDLEDLVNLYRSTTAGKRILILADNARSSEQVRPLLSTSPGSLTLVTSRCRLTGLVAREGVRRLTVGPLPPEDAETLLEQIIGTERLRDEPGAARDLARACGSLPLALRIAAANLANHPHWRTSGYVNKLLAGNRLAALETSGDEPIALQRIFDQSFATVPPDAQAIFLRLGLIPGPDFTAEAAAAMAAIDPGRARELLDHLLDAHLIEESADGRYSLHDLVLLYARTKAGAEITPVERTAARRRLFDWYLAHATEAVDWVFPHRLRLPPLVSQETSRFSTDNDSLAWLEAEYPNLLAALHAADGPHTWHLTDTLRCYFHLRNMTFDWLSAASAALTAAQGANDPEAEFSGRYNLAQVHLYQGDYPKALKHFETGLRLARDAGNPEAAGACESSIGRLLTVTGELDQAVARLLTLIADTDGGKQANYATTMSNLGMAYLDLGRLREADKALQEALDIYQDIRSRNNEAYALANLGLAAHALGDLDRAERLITGAVAVLRAIGDADVESACLSDLAAVHLDAGRIGVARQCAEQAWNLACQVKASKWALPVLSVLATTRRSLQAHKQVIHMASSSGMPGLRARLLLAAARTASELGEHEQAVPDALEALHLASKYGYRIIEGNSLIMLAEAEQASSDKAIAYARRALEIHSDAGHRLGAARAEEILVRGLRQ